MFYFLKSYDEHNGKINNINKTETDEKLEIQRVYRYCWVLLKKSD